MEIRSLLVRSRQVPSGLLRAPRKVVKGYLDRNGYQYHGRVQALANGVREGGLTF